MTSSPDVLHANIANYDSAWSAGEYTRESGLRKDEVRIIEEHFPKPPAKILDLGCGAGRTTGGLADMGYQVVGIDLSDQLLKLASERRPHVEFRKMDATALEYPDASFDAVIFSYNGIDCIYPASSREKCMAQVCRVLKPGGPFLMSSHNLVGSLFSGGFFYLTGHRNALKMLAAQISNRLAWQWFIRYRDGGGVQHLYSAPPGRTIRQLKAAGFEISLVRGFTGEERPGKLFWHQQHVHFLAMKPK